MEARQSACVGRVEQLVALEWLKKMWLVLNPCVHIKQGAPCTGVALAKLWCA